MNNKFINGTFFTKITNIIFRIIQLPVRAVGFIIKVINKLTTGVVTKRIDSFLSRVAKQKLAKTTTVDDNTIVLTAMQGEYTCNIKYIAEELISRKLPYNITWVMRGASLGPYPPEMKFVRDKSPAYFKEIAKAKVVIQNGHSLQRNGVHKNPGQYWLQTWHGSLGLKRLEGAGGDEKFYNKMKKLDSSQTDYLISNSQFEDDVFQNTYWPDVPTLKLGHARNDILFDATDETAKRLRKKILLRLGIEDTDQKFLLFAPTHNDKDPNQAFGNVDYQTLRDKLGKKFGGKWEILIRTHNNNKRESDGWLAGLPLFCHNASFYPDMQELMVLADAGLSDYSSWVCDYITTQKPSFLFGANIKKFNRTRGFYHKIEDTPFSMAISNDELIKNIETFDQAKYERKIAKFLKVCGSIDDGKASARIVDKIEELMAK